MSDAAGGRRTAIALLTNEIGGDYQGSIARFVGAFCAERGVDLFVLNGGQLASADPTDRAMSAVYRLIASDRIDGVLLTAATVANWTGLTGLADFLGGLPPKPTVAIGAAPPGMPSVRPDNGAGIAEAVRHLAVKHGLRRIAYLGGPLPNTDAQERLAAFRTALAAVGLPRDPSLEFAGDFFAPSGRVLADAYVRGAVPPFDALLAANDRMAVGFQQTLAAHGIRVPEDLAVVGFDDDPDALYLPRPLTTVRQPYAEMCRDAGEALLALIEGRTPPPDSVRPVRFLVRESCGCPAAGAAPAAPADSARPAGAPGPDEGPDPDGPDPDDALFLALTDEAAGRRKAGAFRLAWQRRLAEVGSRRRFADFAGFLARSRRRLVRAAADPAVRAAADALLQSGQFLTARFLEHRYAADIHYLSDALMAVNDFARAAMGLAAPDGLPAVLDRALANLKVDYCAYARWDDTRPDVGAAAAEPAAPELPAGATLVYLYRRDRLWNSQRPELEFPTLGILPEAGLPPRRPLACLVMPLVDSGRLFGFLAFDAAAADPAVYELLRAQVSASLGRMRLLDALAPGAEASARA